MSEASDFGDEIDRVETNEEACARIAYEVLKESPELSQLIVMMKRMDGSTRSIDNGLNAEEAKEMLMSLHSWIDRCLGREDERDTNK